MLLFYFYGAKLSRDSPSCAAEYTALQKNNKKNGTWLPPLSCSGMDMWASTCIHRFVKLVEALGLAHTFAATTTCFRIVLQILRMCRHISAVYKRNNSKIYGSRSGWFQRGYHCLRPETRYAPAGGSVAMSCRFSCTMAVVRRGCCSLSDPCFLQNVLARASSRLLPSHPHRRKLKKKKGPAKDLPVRED